MPRKAEFDRKQLDRILREQQSVVTRAQAFACGMSRSVVQVRIAPPGPWQRVLPGVYLAHTGGITQYQREMAALLYAGPASLITGPAAVRRHGLSSAGADGVDLLIPAGLRRQNSTFVRVHRTERMPERMLVTGKIRFAEAPRAVADAARLLTRLDDVRAVVCEAVQRRACTVADLAAELAAGPSAGSARLREALAEIADGVRSVAEIQFRDLILRSGLPRPMFNARLFAPDGTFIAMVDAWWPEAGVAAEVDSRAYHLSAADQDRTTDRHDRLIARGILALHFAPKRIKTDGAGVVEEIRQSIREGLQRPPLPVRALPPEG